MQEAQPNKPPPAAQSGKIFVFMEDIASPNLWETGRFGLAFCMGKAAKWSISTQPHEKMHKDDSIPLTILEKICVSLVWLLTLCAARHIIKTRFFVL